MLTVNDWHAYSSMCLVAPSYLISPNRVMRNDRTIGHDHGMAMVVIFDLQMSSVSSMWSQSRKLSINFKPRRR